jgi:hypothetical protein
MCPESRIPGDLLFARRRPRTLGRLLADNLL